MSKNNMCILRGIGTALAAGAIVGFVSGQIISSQKKNKKKTDKAVHAVGDILDNVHSMFK